MTETKKNASFTELDLGVTGRNVAANVARLREAYGLSYNQLSSKLTDLENPIPPVGLRRIEARARRVTVDDLFAIALALGVPPLRLLTGKHLEEVHGTGIPEGVHYLEAQAWMRGDLDDFSTGNRWRFWAQRYRELTQEAKLKEGQVAKLEGSDREDPQSGKMLAFAEMSLERTRAAIDDAFDQMERLGLIDEGDAVVGFMPGGEPESV